MNQQDVRVIKLEAMRVATVRAISETPERDTWEKMRAWAEPRGMLEDIEEHPIYGFNNPDPLPGRKEYGYEFWIRVGPEVQPEEGVEVHEFEGGLYAVTTCKLQEEVSSEFFAKKGYLPSWQRLLEWVESSAYNLAAHQALEKFHNPGAPEEELILDLHIPIME